MKILFTLSHVTIGGAQRVCLNLIRWLQNNNNEVLLLIYSRKETGGFKYDLAGIIHKYLSKNSTLNKIVEIRDLTKDFKPDVFVSFGVPNCLFDIPATIGLDIKNIICERNDPAHFAGKTLTKILSRLLMKLADGYVFQTKDAQQFYGGKIAKHSVVIPNPLFLSTELMNIPLPSIREKIIVTTGRLNKQKNHPLLIRAFKNISEQIPDYKLIIYGEGEERYYDEMLIMELGLQEKVFLPGSINDVFNTIRTASLFVLSSDFEGMPNSLMEAMSIGIPCISTDCPCGGPKSLIDNNINGILIPVHNQKELENAILRLIKDSILSKNISFNSLEIRKTHSLDTICRKWFDYICYVNSK